MKVDPYKPQRCKALNLQIIFNEVQGEGTVILSSIEYVKGQRHARPMSVEYRVPTQVPASVDGCWEALAEVVLNRTLPLAGD